MSNFEFLKIDYPALSKLGSFAEDYLYSDSNSCLIKLGMFAELITDLMFKLNDLPEPEENTTHNRILILRRGGFIPREIDDIFYAIRKARNKAAHDNYSDLPLAKTLIEMAHKLAIWFMRSYTSETNYPTFILPVDNNVSHALKPIDDAQLQQDISTEITQTKGDNVSIDERLAKTNKATTLMELSEKETRVLIDEQLRKAGWLVDSENLRYANGVRPEKGKNIAIAEWPTDAESHDRGRVDYALFVGMQLVALVEAKKASVDVPSVIDVQCKDYAKNIKDEHSQHVINDWNGYKVPFIYATNGRKYLEQIKTKSGIWTLDLRNNSNKSYALQSWPSPQNFLDMLEKDIDEANKTLRNTSYDLLEDSNGLNLRKYQIKAIQKVEEAVIDGKQAALLAMATGTGKTRTILGMIYRFLVTKRFYRILFLVDRTSLGDQASEVFTDVKLEDLLALDKIYSVKGLGDKEIEQETKLHVATVQSLLKRVMYSDDDKSLGVSDYDLIIIDEAHRGYTLDKELDDDELLYRDQTDFLSKYKFVVDYFDAVKVALTATPALHTKDIFGTPVYNYTYREAVVDGFLVDHDAPHNLKTKLNTEGIKYDKGETIAIYDKVTGEIINSSELEDEVLYEVESFNRRVITPEFNRTVLQEIANYIDPEDRGKTLIYAVDDHHADMIVEILRDIYSEYGIDNDAILKITGKTGDKKRVDEAIKKFKNERFPNIAVTVDLLTTGIDVPKICNLVFMRRVKSRILFEQMLGRATRKCDEINKTHFEIYDPVGVYESLKPYSSMKPIVPDTNATFEDLLTGLSRLDEDAQIQNIIDKVIVKMRRMQKRMSADSHEKFEVLADEDMSNFIANVQSLPPTQAKEKLLNNPDIFKLLSSTTKGDSPCNKIVLSDKEDELISHTRGYGKGQKPEDYLESFKQFIEENADKIEALKLVCTAPASLTRTELKKLKLTLDDKGFSEKQLNSALKETKNVDIFADIITLVRSQLGGELLDHETRIKRAIAKLKRMHSFNAIQQKWLDRIQTYLLEQNIIDDVTFNEAAFKDQGGFNRIDKIFQHKLNDYIIELNQYLYEDGGNVA